MTALLPSAGAPRAHGEGAAPCTSFHCTVDHIGDGLVLTPCGDLDVAALPHLAGPLCRIGPGTRWVHLDLSAVGFMDSSGLSFLSRLQSRCARARARLEVAGLRTQHRQFLDRARFTLLVPASS
ncbi:STAS domain-containing protein [Kitasatospora sp. A2-31]|uniref:STAS domain-containing protein n=1 Tax=Kitasatospora sp. A2-31 TaxID=2916414 RepID=UPI001EEB06F9|nr:STAS domain-containing protein [Kitasatospora sp. A2-31]MCG6498399.1 STAS domain-containing protein [Kitasatospora sp. A2-31]